MSAPDCIELSASADTGRALGGRKFSLRDQRGHSLKAPQVCRRRAVKDPPRIIGRIPFRRLTSTPRVPVDMGEARRIAGELAKLYRDGLISGARDPEATFYAWLVHTFDATYEGNRT
jgi:hypothetical protein